MTKYSDRVVGGIKNVERTVVEDEGHATPQRVAGNLKCPLALDRNNPDVTADAAWLTRGNKCLAIRDPLDANVAKVIFEALCSAIRFHQEDLALSGDRRRAKHWS